jgi:hypothetical protein
MEALSVYGRPMTPTAVDFMLSPFISGIDSAPVLGRLLNMHFVRKEEGRYYLHPVDCDYAFSRIPPGKPEDRNSDEIPFTQFALLHSGADYFEQVRKTREEWKTKDDLVPQLAEFETARSYEYPPNDHNVLALSGVIALRMGEIKAAKDAFVSAIAKADEMLAKSKNNFSALYAKGLSLSGAVRWREEVCR